MAKLPMIEESTSDSIILSLFKVEPVIEIERTFTTFKNQFDLPTYAIKCIDDTG